MMWNRIIPGLKFIHMSRKEKLTRGAIYSYGSLITPLYIAYTKQGSA